MMNGAKSIGPRRATLAVEVRGEIERMIVDGELAAGEKLNELALSNAMGVSRGTVREAIRSLADSGLIDLIANRGAFVHETTLDEVRNLYELRGAIFGMACAAAARRVGAGMEAKLVAALDRNLDQMRAVHAKMDTARYYALNIEFHDLLLQGAGNPKAKVIYDNLVKEMHLFRRKGLSVATNIAKSIEEHDRIVRAVANADAEAARLAALDHITGGFARYTTMIDVAPATAV
ncbi:GntR family transcriptional regulator [Roseicyclus marinus]|uniref:GntR family transcriptional regulator n=1 Tax=Roseicyclus marinus TaxID=2161673 RepID=UPI00240EB033|nr:GntR family transcriptional regulator [Roseicyclus marinus]MDG3040185.1 GntR family transcriptional regulator [Roseicyclus marinus]